MWGDGSLATGTSSPRGRADIGLPSPRRTDIRTRWTPASVYATLWSMSSTSPQRLLTIVLVVAALTAIVTTNGSEGARMAHYIAKPLATVSILAIALTARPASAPRYRWSVAAGLFASLVGDILLMLPRDLFVAGLAAFLVAHLCYLAAFLGESRLLARPIALVGYALVAVTLAFTLFPTLPAALRVPVLAYMAVITVMAAQGASWMLATPSESARRAAAGGAWFLVSDATLAIDRFRVDVPYRELLVLGTYFVAQWCIARSVARTIAVSGGDSARSRPTMRLLAWLCIGVGSGVLSVGLSSAVALPAAAQGRSKGGAPSGSPSGSPGVVSTAPQARLMRAGDVDTIPLVRAMTRVAYGRDSLQFGELRLPDGRGPFPVAIIVHGGCWLSRYASVRNSAPLAEALAAAGIATWNVEYRRYDHPGGGWPGTFRDVADGADYVRTLARQYALDTTRVVVAGHSAGAHLALWFASRRTLPAASAVAGGTPLALRGVVAIGGITDLREFFLRQRTTCGNPGVESLLGGVPDSVPERVRETSPIERLPLGVPSVHIAGDRDFIAPLAVRAAFVDAARARGDSAWLVTVAGEGHFEAMTPARATGRAVIDAIRTLLSGPTAR